MKNKNSKKNKMVRGRKSLRGIKGTVGAPAIPVKYPKTPFTFAKLANSNSKGKYKQCQLSVRTKLDADVASGAVISLKPRKQAKGAVGRPSPMYVLKSSFNPAKMVTAPAPKKTGPKAVPAVAVETPIPAVAPAPAVVVAEVVPTPAPVENIVTPAPVTGEAVTP